MAGKTKKETMAIEVDKMTPEMQKQYHQDKKMVRGRFHFHEIPNGSISFVYRKYKDDPLKSWTFQDGEIYTIPLGLARHLNKDCSYPEHEHAKDEDGKSIVKIGRRIQRCSFESLEFMPEDLPEAGSRILTAEESIVDFPEVNPMFRPSMRLINLVTLGTAITTIETSQPHLYESGLTVRIIIPPHFGLEQLNNYLAAITVTSPTTFTMELNSSAFNPAAVPVTPLQYNSFPHVIPVGEINSMLHQATRNILG